MTTREILIDAGAEWVPKPEERVILQGIPAVVLALDTDKKQAQLSIIGSARPCWVPWRWLDPVQ